MVIFFDGRSKGCRRKLDGWLAENYPDASKQAELWVTYAGMTASSDPREAKRRVAFSDSNRECVMVGWPVPKTVLKAKPRPCFTACGEVSTHNQSYSGVAKRSLRTLPRLQPGEKQTMIGEDLAELPSKFVEGASGGHPLFWQEVKTAALFRSSCLIWEWDMSSTCPPQAEHAQLRQQ